MFCSYAKFKKVPLEAKGTLMYHSGDTCVIHTFFKIFFEKTAELCSEKGAALSLPLAAIPLKKLATNAQLKKHLRLLSS